MKLTLLRTGYLSLAVNMLVNSPNILHVNKDFFSQLNCLAVNNNNDKDAVVEISTVLAPVYHVACRWVLPNVTP